MYEEENWDEELAASPGKQAVRQNNSFSNDRNWQNSRNNFNQHTNQVSYPSRSENNTNWRSKNSNSRPGQRDGNSWAVSRKPKNNNSIELYIPNNAVGLVIGKGGSKIRELQDTSAARIYVDKNSGVGSNDMQTLIKISGDASNMKHAKDLILALVEEKLSDPRTGGASGGQRKNGYQDDSDAVQVNVPDPYISKIIGRGGSNIKDMQERSGAQIKVTNNYTEDDEVIVKIRGNPDQVKEAKRLIDDIVNPYSSKYGTDDGEKPEPVNWAKLKEECEAARAKWLADLPQIERNFYVEDPSIANMEENEVDIFRKNNNNIVANNVDSEESRDIPNPVIDFKHAFQHYPEIMEQIRLQGFQKPSPIQCQAWPVVLQGIDLIGIAQTGTGKTIAFLLPALIHLEHQTTPRSERIGPSVLILAPTRELAQQIEREAKKYEYRGIRSVCVYGGGSRKDQVDSVKKGVEIVIATPGRLSDLCQSRALDLSCVTFLVLDEADRMLDMGFEPQINKILIDVRPDRQTVMTSATWPEEVRRLALKYTNNPVIVFIGTLDLAACHSVTQSIILVDETEKRAQLFQFIDTMEEDQKVIIFVGKKAIADDLASDLVLQGIDCQSIHGDREQEDREQALDDIKSGYVKILIATDVASRGLDISDITHIFNFDFPRNVEEYVHRIGRTGRAGRSGHSITLVTREDWRQAEELIKIMEEAEQDVPPELYEMAQRYAAHKEKRAARGGGRGAPRRGNRGGGYRNNRSDFF